MKINIELPDWAEGRRCYVFLGRECYAIREPDGNLWIKKARCNKCGKCCMKPVKNWPLGTKMMEIDGKKVKVCKYLKQAGKEYLCQAGFAGPFSCCKDSIQRLAHPDCSIRYEKIS